MAYSFLDLAFDVLKTAKQPLIYQEIWDLAKATGLSTKINSSGKTPWQTLGARLYVDVRDIVPPVEGDIHGTNDGVVATAQPVASIVR